MSDPYTHRKRTTYLSVDTWREIRAEAKRRKTSVSAVLQLAVRKAMPTLRRLPGVGR